MANPTPNPTPEKKPGIGRNLTGFTGQVLVALAGTSAVAPFRALEIALTMTGATVQVVGQVIATTGLGISWVGLQTGRPGDLVGQAARQVNERVRAWRTQTAPQELGDYVPITCGPRHATRRGVEEMKAKAKEYVQAAKACFAENAARNAAEAAEVPAAPAPTEA
jgi:hypothetical protein